MKRNKLLRLTLLLVLGLMVVFVKTSVLKASETEGTGCEHSWDGGTVTSEATCTEDGVLTYTCTICGGTKTETIEATGHTWDGNVCSSCGSVKESSLSSGTVTLSASSYTYNGSARKPTVEVVINGTTLTKDTDYTVAYSNNTDVGTASVTVTGTGLYSGTVTENFTINKKSISSDSAAASVALSKTSYTYDGSAKKPTPTVKITLNGSTVTLVKGTDYTVSYSSNTNVGTAKVTIKGTGNYSGTLSKTFKINPKSTTLSSLSAASKGFTAKWKTVSAQVSGYQIQYATNSSFTKNKGTVTVSGKSSKTGSASTLKASTKYYVRVRTYKTVSGTKYYSSWSSAKTITTGKKITVFAGDSIMSGLLSSSYNGVKYMSMSGTKKVVAYKGLNTLTFQTNSRFSGKTAVEKIISYKPYRVYLMLGTNEVSWRSVSSSMDNYAEIIEAIQEGSPTTEIVILAIPPVSKSVASSRTGFKKISTYNSKLKALAKEYGCTYYNYTSSFKNSSGYLLSKYNGGDGIHWNLAGYKKFGSLITAYDKKLEN